MKDWQIIKKINMKCGQTYVVNIGNNELLEFSDVFLPNENSFGTRPYRFKDFGEISDYNKRVITVCTMVGCYFNCQFCASRNTYKRNLDYTEIVSQVDFLVNVGKDNNRLENLNDSKELNILLTRMGEPLANIDNVIKAIRILIKKYPNIKIGLSTCGWEQGLLKLIENEDIIPYIMLQFSVHGTDELTRSKLLGVDIDSNSRIIDLIRIGLYIKKFRKYNSRMVSLNFIILEGYNYNFPSLKKYFGIEDVYLRLSPLNTTKNSINSGFSGAIKDEDVIYKKPVSNEFIKNVIKNIEESGFNYAFAPAIDEEIKFKSACGQALEAIQNS